MNSLCVAKKWAAGRFTQLVAAMALLASLVVVGFTSHPALAEEWPASIGGGYDAYIDPNTLTPQNWMAGVSGERYLYEVTMPGTHDALCVFPWCYHMFGSWSKGDAKTQERLLEDQLDMGVRLLDLRVTNCHEGIEGGGADVLMMCHGAYRYGVDLLYYCRDRNRLVITFDDVINTVARFLHEHPSETIICTIKAEYARDCSRSDVLAKAQKALVYHKDCIYTEDRMPKLSEVRGKAVIIYDSSEGATMSYGMHFGETGQGQTTVGGVKTDYENTCDVDHEDKPKKVEGFLNKIDMGLPRDVTKHMDNAVIMYTSSSEVPFGDNPKKIADTVNGKAFYEKNPYFGARGNRYGWVYSDFVDSKMAKMLWMANFPSDLNYCTITYRAKYHGGVRISTERVLRGTTINVARCSLFDIVDNSGWVVDGTFHAPGEQIKVDHDLVFEATNTKEWNAEDTMTWRNLQASLERAPVGPDYTIKLPNDVVADDTDEALVIANGSNVIIDLNGHTIDARSNSKHKHRVFTVEAASSLRLCNGTVKGGEADFGGGIFVEKAESPDANDATTLVLEDVSVEGNSASYEGGGVYVDASDCCAARLLVSGHTKINGNNGGNLYLCKDVGADAPVVEFAGPLADDADIRLSLLAEKKGVAKGCAEPQVFTKGMHDQARMDQFQCDENSFVVDHDEEAAIKLPVNKVTYVNDNPADPEHRDERLVRNGDPALRLEPEPTVDDLVFKGWYTDEELHDAFDFSCTLVTKDLTLYAKWESASTPELMTLDEAREHGISLPDDTGAQGNERSGHETMVLVRIPDNEVLETFEETSCQCYANAQSEVGEQDVQVLGEDDLAAKAEAGEGTWEVLKEQQPTCAAPGYCVSILRCAECHGILDAKTERLEPRGHTWKTAQPLFEPTCTEDGLQIERCATCRAERTKAIDRLGHDFRWDETSLFDNPGYGRKMHICTRCHFVDEVQTVPKPAFAGQHLIVESVMSLGADFYFPENLKCNKDESFVEFEIGDDRKHTVVVPMSEARVHDDGQHYTFVCPISAIEMASNVKATLHYDGDKTTVKNGLTLQECINAYGQGPDILSRNYVHAMADYGYYAQRFFAQEHGWTLGRDYAAMDTHFTEKGDFDKQHTLSQLSRCKADLIDHDTCIKRLTCSLVCGPTISMELTFTLYKKPERFTGSIDFNGNTYSVERISDTQYRLIVPGITADKLGECWMLRIDTDSAVTLRIYPLSYAYASLASGKLSPEGEAFMCALNEYFNTAEIWAFKQRKK